MLHGFMMRPGDLSPFAASIGLPACWLFPEGPVAARPVGRAWWDIDPDLRAAALAVGPRDFAGQHPADLPRARTILAAFLDEAAALAGDRPLVVGGFSQGGMLLCDLLLRAPRPVAGLVLLSSSRIACDEWPPPADRLRGLPALISHGHADPDLAFTTGEALRDAVRAEGADVTWVPFEGGHEIPLPVWRRLRQFLTARF
jgi:phospholipase/carboxylesterase